MEKDIKYCIECGYKLKLTDEICPSCGTMNLIDKKKVLKNYSEKMVEVGNKTIELGKETANQIKNNEELQSKKEEYVDKAKKSAEKIKDTSKDFVTKAKNENLFNKKNILKFALVLVLIFGLYVIAFKQESPENVVNNFKEAIIDKNISKIQKMITSEDKRLDITNENIESLISFYDSNPSYLEDDMYSLLNYETGTVPFELKSKKFLFKDKYYISVVPSYINVSGGTDSVKIEVKQNDKVIMEFDKYCEIGPIMPGNYDVVATYKNDFIETQQIHSVDLFTSQYLDVGFFYDLNEVEISTNNEEAILYINGKSTGKNLKEIDIIKSLNDGTTLHAELKIGEDVLKSNVETVYDSDVVYLEILDTKETLAVEEEVIDNQVGDPPPDEPVNLNEVSSDSRQMQALNEFFYDYENSFVDAVNNGDFSIVEPYLMVNESLYNEHQSAIPSFYERGITETLYSFNINKAEYLGYDNLYEVEVLEKIGINKSGTETIKDFRTTYLVSMYEMWGGMQIELVKIINQNS